MGNARAAALQSDSCALRIIALPGPHGQATGSKGVALVYSLLSGVVREDALTGIRAAGSPALDRWT